MDMLNLVLSYNILQLFFRSWGPTPSKGPHFMLLKWGRGGALTLSEFDPPILAKFDPPVWVLTELTQAVRENVPKKLLDTWVRVVVKWRWSRYIPSSEYFHLVDSVFRMVLRLLARANTWPHQTTTHWSYRELCSPLRYSDINQLVVPNFLQSVAYMTKGLPGFIRGFSSRSGFFSKSTNRL